MTLGALQSAYLICGLQAKLFWHWCVFLALGSYFTNSCLFLSSRGHTVAKITYLNRTRRLPGVMSRVGGKAVNTSVSLFVGTPSSSHVSFILCKKPSAVLQKTQGKTVGSSGLKYVRDVGDVFNGGCGSLGRWYALQRADRLTMLGTERRHRTAAVFLTMQRVSVSVVRALWSGPR